MNSRIIFTLTFLLLIGCGSSLSELSKMAKEDQDIREKLASSGAKDTVLALQMLVMDSSHTMRLKEMLHGRQWFGDSELKRRDRISAFMLLDHSPDTALQAAALPVLKVQAAKEGSFAKQMVASLEDRVLIQQGKPQIFGTQVRVVGDSLIVLPIADSANVDVRRSSIGLDPLNSYLKMLRSMIPKNNQK